MPIDLIPNFGVSSLMAIFHVCDAIIILIDFLELYIFDRANI